MATVKLQNGNVVLIDGKVSCECCDGEFIACDTITEVSGRQGAIFRFSVFLGAGTGTVTFSYEPFEIPDRFVVIFEGQTVIDTGYVGLVTAEFLQALGDALGEPTSINAMTTPQGEPETRTFEKTTATETARVLVYAPLNSTAWYWAMSCVNSAP